MEKEGGARRGADAAVEAIGVRQQEQEGVWYSD